MSGQVHIPLRYPMEQDLSWQDHAFCKGRSDVNFFPERGFSSEPAKTLCRQCSVISQCLEYALAINETHGVYGGMSVQDRKRERRARQHKGLMFPVAKHPPRRHGDEAGYKQHLRRGEDPCVACRKANNKAKVRTRALRRARRSKETG